MQEYVYFLELFIGLVLGYQGIEEMHQEGGHLASIPGRVF